MEIFYFLSGLMVVAESFKKDFWEVSALGKCFQQLGIERSVILYIFNG